MEIRKFDPQAKVEIVSDNKAIIRMDNSVIPKLIGKKGKVINQIESKLGIHLEIEPRMPALGREINYALEELGNSLEFIFGKKWVGKVANFYIDGEFLFSATIGKKGKIKVTKASDIGKALLRAIYAKKEIKVLV